MRLRTIKPDKWPAGVSDGLTLACHDCGEVPRFDYGVTDDFWCQYVPRNDPAHRSVVCLPCLELRCGGVGLAEALVKVQWTGRGHTVVMRPIALYAYGHIDASV